jgi:hypothetical protein
MNCVVIKYSVFFEQAQGMSVYLDTYVNVHHWLARNNFNSSDGLRHRLCWIRVHFFIGIKVVVCPLSKIIGGNVSSHMFF